MLNNFCVFILTHGRPDNIITYNTLMRDGYTGKVFLVVDNEDKFAHEYISRFGADKVVLFDKRKTAERFDELDNFNDRRAIVYARNECFEIARKLGYKYFLELDDDYVKIGYRLHVSNIRQTKSNWLSVSNTIDGVFGATLELYKSIGAKSIAYSQGGDWMDGTGDGFSRRKCMNTFFCSTDRPFNFVGRINEDVNTYTWYQGIGNLFLTIPHIQICQKQTQKTEGGMSGIYLSQGTYIKSFYTIICSPSCVKIKIMGSTNRRMHHKVDWNTAVPMLLDEKHVIGKRIKLPPPLAIHPRSPVMTVAEINQGIEL